jgi:hypothetical protein
MNEQTFVSPAAQAPKQGTPHSSPQLKLGASCGGTVNKNYFDSRFPLNIRVFSTMHYEVDFAGQLHMRTGFMLFLC